ncbi:MAG: FIST C-terminal domain-containing protein [Chloroflexi bacterium]|nr:FIST C-terminal domain-containing protein [Chloroflexota bacterium]
MNIEQRIWTPANSWTPTPLRPPVKPAHLVLVFGSKDLLAQRAQLPELRVVYPGALIIGCSTSGEISGLRVLDDSLSVTALHFETTRVEGAAVQLSQVDGSSFNAGRQLATHLPAEGLVHVLVLSDGSAVNGSELVRGLTEILPSGVAVTGGLAGDGDRFESTLVFIDGDPQEGLVAAVGLYGDNLKVGYGSMGGWDPFGPDRVITRAAGNVLYELDGQAALTLYKRYLGDYTSDLPASALLFPLAIRAEDGVEVVRTILNIDERNQSMTFAGDMPVGSRARLMKANFERLMDGAEDAAQASYDSIGGQSPELAILISCVGRKLVLKQRVEDEIESVQGILGKSVALTGFYSYGEISPAAPNASCELHNQTMTITTLSER